MTLPAPKPGLVIHYGFLWRHEAERGIDNARYPRPCAIVAAVRRIGDDEVEVLVTPFTHQRPPAERRAVELPPILQTKLGLPKRTWVLCDELNAFVWPGLDLDRNPAGDFAWGELPNGFVEVLKAAVLEAMRTKSLVRTPR